jgi:protocatechuate 3,4-dioxygenase beta subunit
MMLFSFLANRYVVTFGGIAVLAAVWNLYVAFNDDGILAGQVVGPNGRPAPGVAVELAEKGFLIAAPKGRITTDEDGRFRFTGHRLYRLQLEAHKEGVGRMQAKEFRLYFKGQNMTLREPLRLQGSAPAGVTPQR